MRRWVEQATMRRVGFPHALGSGPWPHLGWGGRAGRRQCQTKFYAPNAMAKEQVPALVVMASANGPSRVSIMATAKNVTAVANSVAKYAVATVKSNRLLLSLRQRRQRPPQALQTSISRAVSPEKRKEVKGGRAAARQSRYLKRRSRASNGIQLMSAFDTKRTSCFALHMTAFGCKADIPSCTANVR
jgi:hypothetical protein